MNAKYRRITLADRCQISACLESNLSLSRIATMIGKSKSSVSREVLRNSDWMARYFSSSAHNLAHQRRRHVHRPAKVVGEVQDIVTHLLFEAWSPRQIAGRLSLERKSSICAQTIYTYLNQKDPKLRVCLKFYNRRGAGRFSQRKRLRSNQNRLGIENRPLVIDRRQRFGDWERDCLVAANNAHILVVTERKSRFTKIAYLKKRTQILTNKLSCQMIKSKKHPAKSITNDNGSENLDPSGLPVPVYYCTPYKPQQRGTVENTIGLIRKYIKRKTNLDQLPKDFLRWVQKKLNHQPRQILGYRTPFEVFYGVNVALVS